MATVKVSALTAKTSLAGSEELLINDGGTSKKVTATNLLAGATVANGSISTDKIADDAVTADKLANAINSAIAANTAKTGITSGQASAIVANTAKTGITSTQADAIVANTAKTGITSGQASAIVANTAKTGITSGQASAITANTAKVTNATHTGEVTGATALTIADDAVTAAKLANSINTDIATGVTANTTANAALPKAGGTLTGTVTVGANSVGTMTTDNDGSFAMSASNNFKCTPAGNFALTFTAIVAQSGNILFINSGGHTISAHANTKVDANLLATISTAGTYLLSYFSDGTNVYMTNSAVYA